MQSRLKMWQWLWLLVLGSLFPIYNIILNNFFVSLGLYFFTYIIIVMATNVILSLVLFLNFNYFRKQVRLERRLDMAFMLYVLAVSFGSFFNSMPTNVGLFIVPFVVIYFLEIKSILDEFPRE